MTTPEESHGDRTKRRWITPLMAVASVVICLSSATIGAERIGWTPVWHHLWRGPGTQTPASIILWDLRFPRIVLGFMVGAALAGAGTCLQGIFRNPMADPYVLGVSAGGALGAALALAFHLQYTWMGWDTVPLFALVGALGASALVYALGYAGQRRDSTSLLLAGIAISALLSALMSLITVIGTDRDVVQAVYFWLLGGLYTASWQKVMQMLPYGLIGLGVILAHARELNALLLGEETAHHVGVDVVRIKWMLLCAVALVAGAAVSVSGIIGFVGLIAPHAVRLVVGPDHRVLLPNAALAGGAFLVLCDTLARGLMPPKEIPVGIFSALIGVPFFLYLLYRSRTACF